MKIDEQNVGQNNGTEPRRIAVSVDQAAAMINVSSKSIRRLIDRGLLKPCRALRHLRIPVAQIEALLK